MKKFKYFKKIRKIISYKTLFLKKIMNNNLSKKMNMKKIG